MSLYSKWVQLVEPSLEKSGLSIEGTESLQLHRAPIYFVDEEQKWTFVPKSKSNCLNIVPLAEELFRDEFVKNENAGVLLPHKNFSDKKWPVKNVFFQPNIFWGEAHQQALSQVETQINFGIDPYSLALWKGELCDIEALPKREELGDSHKVFRLSTMAYSMAGATPVQQLAILLSTVHQLIKDYEGTHSAQDIIDLTSFELSISNHVFININKLQALRQLMARFLEVMELPEQEIKVYAMPSPRYLATREPWNNLLRLTAMGFASLCGGADGFFSLPYDILSKQELNRSSRNALLVLQEESFLSKVQYPSLGSGLTENLLDQMCEKAWVFFQEIEKKKGLSGAIQSGWLQGEIERSNKEEIESFVQRKTKMIGVNEFALLNSLSKEFQLVKSEEKKEIGDWWIDFIGGDETSKKTSVQRLKPFQLSSEFENWQFLSDQYKRDLNTPLKVTLFCEDTKIYKEKLGLAKKLIGLSGIEIEFYEKSMEKVHQVALFIAADPEGTIVLDALEELKEKGCQFSIWVGEREQEHFDDYMGESSNLMESFRRIFDLCKAEV